MTTDGANLWLRTNGPNRPYQPSVSGIESATSGLFLEVKIQTGDPRYYWLNDLKSMCMQNI